MQITLPEPIFQKAERIAAERGFPSVGAYVSELVESDESLVSPFRNGDAEVEAALLAGLASSPSSPLERSDWDELRRRVVELHAKKTNVS